MTSTPHERFRRTRVKICGLCQPAEADAAVRAGADAIGLVFVSRSPRAVTVEQARAVASMLPPFVEPVGLFVDEPAAQIRRVAEAVGLRTVQLHGHEQPPEVARLAGLRVIKAMRFERGTIQQTLQFWRGFRLPNLEGLLLDAPPPHENALTGGSGQAFDWQSLARHQQQGDFHELPPLILAGGLTPQNVAEAIRTVRPYAVDVSSGVEHQRGQKDAQRIEAFCAAVQKTDAETMENTPAKPT